MADFAPVPTESHLGLITAADVEAEQKRTLAQAQADNAAVQACAALDPTTRAQWNTFYTSLTTFCGRTIYNLPWPWAWFNSNGSVVNATTGETMMAFEAQLVAWENLLRPKCANMPPAFGQLRGPGGPSDNTTSIIKWAGIAVAAVAGAYVVSQVVPPIVGLLPKHGSEGKKKPNPLRGRPGPKKSRALIAKATRVELDMSDGRTIKPRGTMFHDPSGRAWPAKSLLIGPFRPNTHGPVSDNEYDGAPEWYLGRGYRARYGTVSLPPRSIRAWTFVGYASAGKSEDGEIRYHRRGSRAPGGFYHPWNRRSWTTLIHGHGRVRLYRYGSFYRLEMPRGSVVDDRGFVWP